MNKVFIYIPIALCLIFIFSCKKDKTPAPEMKQVNLTAKQKEVISSSNAFGFEFFGKVSELSEATSNLMVSPLSVSMALGMTRNGAANQTLEDMTKALGFAGQSEPEINESYQYILKTFSSLDPKVNIQIANSIWYRNSFVVEDAFATTNRTYFDASVTSMDFNSPTAVEIINAWVKEKTNNLIASIINVIPGDAVMYLVNAVYFKGQWKYQFEKANTTEKDFRLTDGSTIKVPAMAQHTSLDYLKVDGFEAVELPYNQGNFVMTVILPDENKSIADVISQLTLENWQTWSNQFRNIDIQLQLPKFKYEYEEQQMKPVLSDLGMGIAFEPDQADFTRINSEGGLYISKVVHKTFIQTDEVGTEAAAVTSVEIGTTSAGPGEPYFFKVDRPFVYFIQEKSTGTILFIGTVMNPGL